MEEKERYEYFFGTNTIKDNKTNQFYGYVVDLLNQQDKELSKLRASYQKVKEENQQLIKALNGEVFINYKLPMENAQLKQQLAESEKERELDNSFWKQECDSLQKTLAEKDKEIEQVTSKLQASYEKEQNQKAIEQLEKVKEDVKNVHIEDTQYDCYCFQETTRDDCVKIIDNQIKQLKDGK